MAESTYHQAGQQHLAFLQQRQSQTPGAHNPWAAEASLEAHLQQQQHQAALVAVQALERERLRSLQDLVENPPL